MLLIVNKVINGLTELLNETKEESNKKMNKVKIKEEGWTRAWKTNRKESIHFYLERKSDTSCINFDDIFCDTFRAAGLYEKWT